MAAMYTKMTATGSSLIVAPRTISKELEAKIASSISSFISEHGIAKLGTKKVRQYVEKEVHVSLANHKEVLKRLMMQEFRKNKAEKAAKRVVPQPWKIKSRCQSIIKGVHHVYALIRDQKVISKEVTVHAIFALSDLHSVENADVARVAAMYTRMLATIWVQQPRAWPEGRVPTPDEVVESIFEIYAVERIGLCHPFRSDILEFLNRAPPVHSVKDYVGWNPAEGLPSTANEKSRYSFMTEALLKLWFAQSLNLSLGYSFPELLQHLPMFYPYKSSDEVSEHEYRDQIRMITTLVLVLTDFGRLKCEPELLPHEYSYLRQHLVHHIVRQDLVLVSEMLRALRVFVGADNLVSVRRGMALVMLSQCNDGSWRAFHSNELRDVFHTTVRCFHALTHARAQGYAPSIPAVVQLLELNLNADLPGRVLEDDKARERTSADPAGSTPVAKEALSSPSTESENARSPAPEPWNEESIEDQVRFHQSMLEKAGDNVKTVSAALAMQVLTTLASVDLNVDILKSTGIGRTINKLRKHSNEEVSASATRLVAKWKKSLL